MAPALDTAAAVIALALLLGCELASPVRSLKAITAMPTNAIEAAICIGNLVWACIFGLINLPPSTTSANWSDHLFNPGFFTVDGRTGAEQRAIHGASADTRRRKGRTCRVGTRRSGAGAKGAAHRGHLVRSHATAAGKRGCGQKADPKCDAKNKMPFHAQAPSFIRSTQQSITDPREADIDAQSTATIKLSFIQSANATVKASNLHPPHIAWFGGLARWPTGSAFRKLAWLHSKSPA
jgi:hypothetical protein